LGVAGAYRQKEEVYGWSVSLLDGVFNGCAYFHTQFPIWGGYSHDDISGAQHFCGYERAFGQRRHPLVA
jgi:hypothetical protein